MACTNALTTLLRSLAQSLVGEPYLFYQVTFKDGVRWPIIDLYHLGDLKRTMSTNISGYPEVFSAIPAFGPGTTAGGIALRLSRPIHADPTQPSINAGLVVLNPFPADASALMVRATCLQLEGPHGESDVWGCVVHAREGGIDDIAQRKDAIRLALQTSLRPAPDPGLLIPSKPGVRMVTPGSTTDSGLNDWFPDAVYKQLFPTLLTNLTIEHSTFTLELRISRSGPPAVVSFCTSCTGSSFSKSREFRHPELARVGSLTAAGVNIAIPQGNGPASMIVKDFQLLGLRPAKAEPSPRIIKILATVLRRVLVFRRVRAWLEGFAFRDFPLHSSLS
jgi:hypothetical protein